ncbi:MAG TPA: glutamine--fructose-6-phosphate transaminase (isomerizing) [Gemmatimonadota bacterium]|nr:glutamine--fructose-6-phosphate transaminase (isomerizing) [Gemmatimonadota bacterium]
MCGIIGYIGSSQAAPILLEGLRRMEYRGYDSAGVAIINGKGMHIAKLPGRIQGLQDLVESDPPVGTIGVAHTRWATHGPPTQINAHPHTCCKDRIAVVHNGIIENAGALRDRLLQRGHTFKSETDTEVVAHLIEEEYSGDLGDAVRAALRHVEGTYGLVVLSLDSPDQIVAARMGSPLLVGIDDGELFVASDAAAVIGHTRRVIYLDDGEMVTLSRNGYVMRDLENTHVDKTIDEISWDLKEIEKGGYPHFMLKEIFEQPEAIRNAMRGRLQLSEGTAVLGGLSHIDEEGWRAFDRVVLTACGTSWHAALVGEYLLEDVTRIPVEVEYASEFRYRNPVIDDKTLMFAISQSGETADTLAAVREGQRRGGRVLGIVNVVGSSIARATDGGIYIHAGPEIGVASTKAFTCQLTVLSLITLFLGRRRHMSAERGRQIAEAMWALPEKLQQVLERDDLVREIAEKYCESTNFLYLGRGLNFPVALEGALKLKEISYIHAEGYPAAEMKHGPIALIDQNMPVVVVATRDAVYSKVLSNVEEVKARRGRVLAIVNDGDSEVARLADHVIEVPETDDMLTPILSVVPLQLLAYHIAVLRGCDVDKPRNLAKSVTVE